jgi:hypothetical protein
MVGIASSVHCLTTDWTTRIHSQEQRIFLLAVIYIQTSSGDRHLVSCRMGIWGEAHFLRAKMQLGHDADHSPPSSAKVKND